MKTHNLPFAQRPQFLKFLAFEIMTYRPTNIPFALYRYYRRKRDENMYIGASKSFSHIRENEVSNLMKTIQSSIITPIYLCSTYVFVSRTTFGNISEDHGKFILNIDCEVSNKIDLFPSLKHIHLIIGLKANLENIFYDICKGRSDITYENRQRHQRRKERKSH